jgi:biofilm PGA synthesis N-glycosyltransferase PgaC
MKTENTRYVVITPVRDEEEHLQSTIESMIRQTVLPTEWVIVDDGSKDGTGKIIDEYASRYSWIKAIHRTDRGFRKAGGGVVDAFNDGYRALASSDWDFMTKFDGDLTFEPSASTSFTGMTDWAWAVESSATWTGIKSDLRKHPRFT